LREWYQDDLFVEDVMRFLDNVIEDFIGKASDIPGFEKAVASAKAERSVGLGVMGFHSFLQSESIPFESALAVSWNKKIFSWLHQASEKATQQLATERGPCPDAAKYGVPVRNAYRLAVAPTASISILANSVSPSVEPYNANLFIHKTSAGAFTVLNPELVDFLDKKGLNREAVWTSIRDNRGSVQQLDCLDEYEKAIFKTSIEIDQRWVIDHAADRAPFIDQGQSINLFYPADVSKVTLTEDLFRAWRKGVKSLYYNRSRTEHQATTTASRLQNYLKSSETKPDTEECLACQ
jgi:ribonucleoside-diphosphate reductase alpha chain